MDNVTPEQLRHLHLEQLSLILEFCAFFLVTLDLYGKRNLARLQDQIIKYKTDNIKVKFSAFWRSFLNEKNGKRYGTLLITLIILEEIVLVFFVDLHQMNKLFIVAIGGGIAGFTVVFLGYSIFFLNRYSYLFLYAPVRLFQFISNLFPYEHMMIITGTALFVISKVMAFSLLEPK